MKCPSSNAPVSLGALAAAMQAIEVEKILAHDWERVPVGQEVQLAHAIPIDQVIAAVLSPHQAGGDVIGSPSAAALQQLGADGLAQLGQTGRRTVASLAFTKRAHSGFYDVTRRGEVRLARAERTFG